MIKQSLADYARQQAQPAENIKQTVVKQPVKENGRDQAQKDMIQGLKDDILKQIETDERPEYIINSLLFLLAEIDPDNNYLMQAVTALNQYYINRKGGSNHG